MKPKETHQIKGSWADLSWMCLTDSVGPGFLRTWVGEHLGLESLLVHCGPGSCQKWPKVPLGSVFTGSVWKLSVGLGSSWEFLSNCVPWGWREAKYNSRSPGPE